jgi:predicted nuclease of predicted toxin-antitoxin system
MNLVADESVDAPIVERLRSDGHVVAYVAEMNPSITDNDVLEQANSDPSPLMTGDKDFGELVFRLGRVTNGVILIRMPGISPLRKASVVSEALRVHGNEMANAFTVISPGMVRIRHGLR